MEWVLLRSVQHALGHCGTAYALPVRENIGLTPRVDLAHEAKPGMALGETMQWFQSEGQDVLWSAFIRYANTHPDVIETLPDSAHVVLIPEFSLIDEHEGLYRYLTLHGCAAYEPMAYVHLSLEELTFGDLSEEPSVTAAHVEVPTAPVAPSASVAPIARVAPTLCHLAGMN